MTARRLLAFVFAGLVLVPAALAAIPEPEHVFYGYVYDGATVVTTGTVSVRINGDAAAAASYDLGSVAALGTRYVLRVPLSSGFPRIAGTAQPGDQAAFYLGAKLVGAATVGDRGTPQRVDLDSDYHGVAAITVQDLSVIEGDAGTVDAVFQLSISFAVIGDVTVDYATADGSATAPSDYVAKSGTATIPSGQTSTTVAVVVNGDTTPEPGEAFTLALSGPHNATIARAAATCVVADDDSTPSVSVGDASVVEGDAAGAILHLPVTMTSVADGPVTVQYATSGGSAASGVDFTAASATLTIPAGQLAATIDVAILGDTLAEGDESFTVTISSPAGADLGDSSAIATILDDDRLLSLVEVQRNGPAVAGLRGVTALALSPRGEHLYAAGRLDGAVVVFARNPLNGTLTPTQVVQNGAGGALGLGGVSAVAVSPDGKHLYAAGTTDGALAVYARDTGTGQLAFVEQQKNGFGGALGLRGIRDVVVAPDGAHVYAVSPDEDSVVAFSRNAATGGLTFVEAHFQGLGGVDGLDGASAIAMTGSSVYVGSPGSSAVAVLARNATSGALTFAGVQKNGAGGLSGMLGLMPVALAGDGTQLFAGAQTDRALGVFSRDAATGALTFVTRHVEALDGVDGLNGIAGIAASADGRFVFCAGALADALAAFSRDHDGALTFREVERDGDGSIDGVAGAAAVVVSPDSLFVYAAGAAEDAVACFRINEKAEQADPNGDGQLTVTDVFFLINYYFSDGAAPAGLADFNGDGQATVADVFYLINYFFAGGPPPH